jgi:aminomuconate-semialdehyde/2-hydroxymuconate-6-semialdehyde dehydrogenase
VPLARLENYIGGAPQLPPSGQWMEVAEPATGECYSRIPISTAAEIDAAVSAGGNAFGAWSQLPPAERAQFLLRLADLIDRDAEALAQAESDDTGKPLRLARSLDIPRAAANLRFFAAAAQAFSSECHSAQGSINYTLRNPLGVVGCISPWNLPLYLLTWKIAPALAIGNCVVAKPSELTPLTATMLGRLCQEAKLPPGVLNIVHGPGHLTGQALVDHPAVAAISFTGGTETGKKIATSLAPSFRKMSLELGGKNPTIIFADCDYLAALDGAVKAAFSNQGQICLCGSRLYVEEPLYARFQRDFLERTQTLVVGDPRNPNTDLGAVISPAHLQKIERLIRQAVQDGGHVLTGGQQIHLSGRCARGSFFAPTVISNMTTKCQVNQTEIFGPVVSLMPFSREDELIDLANGTPFGLAASLWTSNIEKGHRVASQLQAGVTWINCWMLRDLRTPFGGVKQSGVGREGGMEALRFFTDVKNICVAWNPVAAQPPTDK